MAKILITFAEDGEEPVSFTIPADVAACLDQEVATTLNADGTQVYAGKAEFFLRTNLAILKPILANYPQLLSPQPTVAELQAQKAVLEAQIEQAQIASMIQPVVP